MNSSSINVTLLFAAYLAILARAGHGLLAPTTTVQVQHRRTEVAQNDASPKSLDATARSNSASGASTTQHERRVKSLRSIASLFLALKPALAAHVQQRYAGSPLPKGSHQPIHRAQTTHTRHTSAVAQVMQERTASRQGVGFPKQMEHFMQRVSFGPDAPTGEVISDSQAPWILPMPSTKVIREEIVDQQTAQDDEVPLKLSERPEAERLKDEELRTMLSVMRQMVADASRKGVARPSLAEIARAMDQKSEKADQGESYYYHLNALSAIRTKNDLLFSQDVFQNDKDRREIEALPDLIPPQAQMGEMRQKGLDGKNFIAPLKDPQPRSSYLKQWNAVLSEKTLRKISAVVDELTLEKFIIGEEEIREALGADIDWAAVTLALQLVKRRRLGEEGLSAEQLWARIVSRTDEIYRVAEGLSNDYELAVVELLRQAGLDKSNFVMGPLKDPVRIYDKATDDHGKGDLGDDVIPEAWVFDVLRSIIVVDDPKQMIKLQELLLFQDGVSLPAQGGPISLRLMRFKNRVAKPGPTHFRYLLNNLLLTHGKLSMVCEIQVHHQLMLAWDDKLGSHSHYEFFRSFLQARNADGLMSKSRFIKPDWDSEMEVRMQVWQEMARMLFMWGLDYYVADDNDKLEQPQGKREAYVDNIFREFQRKKLRFPVPGKTIS